MTLKIRSVGKTDIGLVRSGNEDYLHLDDKNGVYAVCDGMGGHQAGEVASMTASETIFKVFTSFRRQLSEDALLSVGKNLPQIGDLLLKSIRLANRAIYNKALRDSSLSGMGTTVVALAFEGDILSIAHVGDSRAYKLNERDLQPLTTDHSWLAEIQAAQNLSTEEATSMVSKNVITRALGVREDVEVDFSAIKVAPGDKFMLCSDGLCGFADDDEIFTVVERKSKDLNRLTDSLIQMANDRGGSDNVTVICLEVLDVDESPLHGVDVFTLEPEDQETLAAEDAWLNLFDEHERKIAEKGETKKKNQPVNKWFLLAIFVVFIILAFLIIKMSPN